MENKNRKALSWSASFAIHATGAVLILVAGFHIATPEGTVTDKTEFEAVTTNTTPQAPAPGVPAPQTDTSAVAPPVAPVTADQPAQPPVVDEAPPKPIEETQHDEEAPPAPTQEVAAADAPADSAQADPAQDPSSTPSEAPTAAPTEPQQVSPEVTPGAEPVPVPAESPAQTPTETPAAAAPSAANTNGDGVPEYGTPGSIIDESKLMEAFGNHKPDYPWMARLRRQQGTVILKAFINKEGHVEQAALEKSSGFPLIDDEAVRTYSRWKYQPGLTGWVLKPFKFSLK